VLAMGWPRAGDALAMGWLFALATGRRCSGDVLAMCWPCWQQHVGFILAVLEVCAGIVLAKNSVRIFLNSVRQVNQKKTTMQMPQPASATASNQGDFSRSAHVFGVCMTQKQNLILRGLFGDLCAHVVSVL